MGKSSTHFSHICGSKKCSAKLLSKGKENATSSSLLSIANSCMVNSDKGLVNGIRVLDFKRPLNAIEHKIFNNA